MGKKCVWGVTDPFDFPPNEYQFGVLQAVEPFLRIDRRPWALRNVPDDVFYGGKMDPEALQDCLHLIAPKLAPPERTYDNAITELNFRLEAIRAVEMFTLPTEHGFSLFQEDDQEGLEIVLAGEKMETNQDDADAILDDDEKDDEKADWEMETHKETDDMTGEKNRESQNDGGSSDSDQDGSNTDTQGANDDVPVVGRTDARLFVQDKRPSKRPDLTTLQRLKISPQRCIAVCEFKPDELWEAIAQAAACARAEARRNLSNLHYKPIYLVALSKTKFTYAVLTAEGLITAGGSRVTDAAYADFVASAKPGAPCTLKPDIDEMFKDGTKFLRSNSSRTLYGKRSYIVGDLYVAPEWYELPCTMREYGFLSTGAKKFYEGLIRMAVGDRVLKWSGYDAVYATANFSNL